MGGIDVGDNAKVIGGSMVIPGSKIPAGEIWRGNPARKWSAIGAPAKASEPAA
jgi:carbonic anhydrase/acetyltransferase-like protein (isoleucine patch superfamily)